MVNEGWDTKRNCVEGGTLVTNIQRNLFTKLLCTEKVTEARSFRKRNEVSWYTRSYPRRALKTTQITVLHKYLFLFIQTSVLFGCAM